MHDEKFENFIWCPGGGTPVSDPNGNGLYETCGFESTCSGMAVCNPVFGICCSKLRTCPQPMLPIAEVMTGRPILCHLRGSPVLECPKGSHCEVDSGFCCTDQDGPDNESERGIVETNSVVIDNTQSRLGPQGINSIANVRATTPQIIAVPSSTENLSKKQAELPIIGHLCNPLAGCDRGAVCQCTAKMPVYSEKPVQNSTEDLACRCDCPKEMGYSLDADGRTCKRTRRRLKEKCRWDHECQAAYSECTANGCRCKNGFQRDSHGGCRPIAYKCINQAPPFVSGGTIIGCVTEREKTMSLNFQTRRHPAQSSDLSQHSSYDDSLDQDFSSSNNKDKNSEIEQTASASSASSDKESSEGVASRRSSSKEESSMEDSLSKSIEGENKTYRLKRSKRWKPTSRSDEKPCPNQYYCVALFDLPRRPNFYQGFCCPIPQPDRPQCPVGQPHDSSHPPRFGCENCPWDHYCHRDEMSTQMEICCPKPCLSPEDVYVDGQCYPRAYHGHACTVSEQCLPENPSNDRALRVTDSEIHERQWRSARNIKPFPPSNPEPIEEIIPSSSTQGLVMDLECRQGKCLCPMGYLLYQGLCKRLQCRIGVNGEPSVDSSGQLLRCRNSHDCGKSAMCDPTHHICCKGQNRCPKGFVETGELCGRRSRRQLKPEQECASENDICIITKHTHERICCAEERVI
ncbi:hypothetical protein DdX_03843 [Ditylenchus destructor]|uniref:EB domain-containing protein n=1 Tax=Ditylenchus destructor TaxID=166010 RepID=A0AAD4NG15_9BILA|nr:hypothetical protein DdX_03843 [Ditylenchus destructor]